MRMFGWLIDKIKTSIAIHRLHRLPAIQCGRRAIEDYWTTNQEVTKDFSKELVKRQAAAMMTEVIRIALSPDPRMANRERLSLCVIEYAQFQVLVLGPSPEPDPTGLRGQPGITGELKGRLLDLARADTRLKEFLHPLPTLENWDDVWNPVFLRYRLCWAWTHVFADLRRAFQDVNPAEDKDWFNPYVAAMCAWEEHQYRESLGMPPVLDDTDLSAGWTALKMSFFMNLVMDGVQYPDLEWRNGMR